MIEEAQYHIRRDYGNNHFLVHRGPFTPSLSYVCHSPSTEEVGHGHVTYEFIWKFTIANCLGSLYEYLNKLDIIRKLQ